MRRYFGSEGSMIVSKLTVFGVIVIVVLIFVSVLVDAGKFWCTCSGGLGVV